MQIPFKTFFSTAVTHHLAHAARQRITGHPCIVGITGSMGKTTTKDALVHILHHADRTVLATHKSMNSEFGLPLTLLEFPTPESQLGWGKVLLQAAGKARKKITAEVCVLEMGVDKPRDMDYLLGIAQPHIGIFTGVTPVHVGEGNFPHAAAIAEEKGTLLASLPPEGIAIVNADDAYAAAAATTARRSTYGLKTTADIYAADIQHTLAGITCTVCYDTQQAHLSTSLIGRHNLYPLLAALLAAVHLGIPLERATASLASFLLPVGRGRILPGIRGSTIIDSSYNASPAAVLASLTLLQEMPVTGRKIALLGQMNELGAESEHHHRTIGRAAAQSADEIVAVHGDAAYYVKAAQHVSIPARYFATPEEAGTYLATTIHAGDIILAKGSQNRVRLEKAIKMLLADPSTAPTVLCRQEKSWLRK